MTQTPFTVTMPATRTTPVVFASPHSGRDYMRAFRRMSVLAELALRSSEDAFIDDLFADAPRHGAHLICATAPRAYLDLNRGAEELDPALITGVIRRGTNPRVSSGLGVIPRVVSGGRQIYRGKISYSEAQTRLRGFWYPYHAELDRLLKGAHTLFGSAILLDCHSMPHEAIQSLCRNMPIKPEIVLGDRFGAAASGDIVDRLEQLFLDAGLKVTRNKPFAGAYIAQHYGRPSQNQHVVQIEIDRALYMNESSIRPNRNFSHLKTLLDRIIAEITSMDQGELPLAAE